MSPKEDFEKEDFEIHLYSIFEGIGHIQRGINIYKFLRKFYKKIKLFIINDNYQQEKKEKLKELINHQDSIDWDYVNFKTLSNFENKYYILILDIRDHDPKMILQNYTNYSTLCLDNHHERHHSDVDYYFTLPHPQLKESVLDTIRKNFFSFEYLKALDQLPSKKSGVLVYLGIMSQKTKYHDFLKNPQKIQSLIKQTTNEVYIIESENFHTPENFYKLLKIVDYVITYPGNLFYEGVFMQKKIICYDLDSEIHRNLISKFRKDLKTHHKGIYYLEEKKEILTFDVFEFQNLDTGKYILSTSYDFLRKWIDEKIQSYATK
ncbi:MAG: hypothetical protein NZ853_05685 [Leptospiraceae bacterium]|nr:hypothetical protein [Leptospiraceae bacterium]MDW7976560.1 hypothetical protein [Leptospiraceae bacterium]